LHRRERGAPNNGPGDSRERQAVCSRADETETIEASGQNCLPTDLA
jgi:hypothetical protein